MLGSAVRDRCAGAVVVFAPAILLFCSSGCSGASEPGEASSVAPSASVTATPALSAEDAERLCLEQVDAAPELTLEQMRELEGTTVYLCDVGPDENGDIEAAMWTVTVPDLEATPAGYDELIEYGLAQSLPFDSEIVEWCGDDSEFLPDVRRAMIVGDQVWRTRLIFCDYNIEDD